MELRIREVDKGGGGLTGTHASEAKSPFPGGKRVGSREKKRAKKIEQSCLAAKPLYAWAKRIPRPLISSRESSECEKPASLVMRR